MITLLKKLKGTALEIHLHQHSMTSFHQPDSGNMDSHRGTTTERTGFEGGGDFTPPPGLWVVSYYNLIVGASCIFSLKNDKNLTNFPSLSTHGLKINKFPVINDTQ